MLPYGLCLPRQSLNRNLYFFFSPLAFHTGRGRSCAKGKCLLKLKTTAQWRLFQSRNHVYFLKNLRQMWGYSCNMIFLKIFFHLNALIIPKCHAKSFKNLGFSSLKNVSIYKVSQRIYHLGLSRVSWKERLCFSRGESLAAS